MARITLAEILESGDDQIIRQKIKECVDGAMSSLTPNERETLRHRFGLDDGKSKMFKEISQLMHVAPSTVHYREKQALKKLKQKDALNKF